MQDAAQLLTCALAVREHKASRNPAVYGTITGDALGGGPAKAMRDGGMDFGKKAADKPKEVKEVKKEPKVEVKKEEVSERRVDPKLTSAAPGQGQAGAQEQAQSHCVVGRGRTRAAQGLVVQGTCQQEA